MRFVPGIIVIHLAVSLGLGAMPRLAAAAPEAADDGAEPEAPDAASLFRRGRYPEAAEAFEREYAESPDPALLFGRAVALQRSGDCFAAIEAFEVFIDAGPPQPDIDEGQRQIARCRQIIEQNAAQPEPVAPPSPEPEPVATTEPGPADRPWHRDPVGSVLVGIGAPVLVTGAILYGGSFAVAGGDQPTMQSDHEARRSQVRGLAAAGLTLAAVGAAAVVAGAIRWARVARRGAAARTARLEPALRF